MTSKHLPALGDAERVLEAADAEGRSIKALRNRVLVYTLHSTGARISELLDLKWSDVDWEQKRVWITAAKGGNDHWAFFHPDCLETMRMYVDARTIEDYTFLIPATKHGHDSLTRHRSYFVVAELAGKAGVKNFGNHSFRHNLGIRVVRSTGNIKLAQKLLGHKSIETTSKFYADLLPEDMAAGHAQVFATDPKAPAQVFAGTIWNHVE